MLRPADDPLSEIGAGAGAPAPSITAYNRHAKLHVSRQRRLLPIFRARDALLYAVETHRVVVVVGETGCGARRCIVRSCAVCNLACANDERAPPRTSKALARSLGGRSLEPRR